MNKIVSVDNRLCRSCGKPYSRYGDGWDGECPDCADRSFAAERSSLEMDLSEAEIAEVIEDNLHAWIVVDCFELDVFIAHHSRPEAKALINHKFTVSAKPPTTLEDCAKAVETLRNGFLFDEHPAHALVERSEASLHFLAALAHLDLAQRFLQLASLKAADTGVTPDA
jgi:hypothetical protein